MSEGQEGGVLNNVGLLQKAHIIIICLQGTDQVKKPQKDGKPMY
jgi:hypothetical protein